MKTVQSAIQSSSDILMQYWPLGSFIASNPLWELREKSFFDAVSHPLIDGLMNIEYYYTHYQNHTISNQDLQKAIEIVEKKSLNATEIAQWISHSRNNTPDVNLKLLWAEQIDEYQFQVPTIWIKEQIFTLLRDYFGLAYYQQSNLIRFWYQQNNIDNAYLTSLETKTIKKAIESLIQALTIPDDSTEHYLHAIYKQVYGWSSLINWRNHHADNPWIPGSDPCEIILLMWLSYEYLILNQTEQTYQPITSSTLLTLKKDYYQLCYIWHLAFELHYLDEIDQLLNKTFAPHKSAPEAQFIFCIDTRSEGIRRHIESQGQYDTFGFAGFFGVIFKLNQQGNLSYQAPALVEPSVVLHAEKKQKKTTRIINEFKKIISDTKKQITSPFALFEILGFLFAFFMLFKTIQPKIKMHPKKTPLNIQNTFSEDEQFKAAYNLLTSIGLVENFSNWILICAHTATSINNPFQSSLDCGACGGNSGIPNAIVICDILNKPLIRQRLKKQGIDIPVQSKFIVACHHTTNDRLEIRSDDLPEKIQHDLNRATEHLKDEKKSSLPGTNAISERDYNWSELIPELGLANNTAIIIGPRALTTNQNLARRVFLHSYSPELDQNGEILSTILSAPAIVAHWISSQYYFSTVNPDLFGAGNKVIHNVLPGIGVLEGNLSDLKIGLPLQSTYFQSTPLHEPRRIIIVVYAKKEILNTAIQNSPEFKKLLDNQWIYLKHIEATA